MPRKTKRQLERAIEDLAADTPDTPGTAEDAAAAAVFSAGKAGDVTPVFHFEHEAGTADVPDDHLAVGEGQSFMWYTPPGYVPEEYRDALPARLPREMSVRFGEVDT